MQRAATSRDRCGARKFFVILCFDNVSRAAIRQQVRYGRNKPWGIDVEDASDIGSAPSTAVIARPDRATQYTQCR
jgi:hypothetical protein